MTTSEALRIVEMLAAGVSPVTGHPFPEGSDFRSAEVIRALHVAVAALQRAERRELRELTLPDKAGRGWSPEEEHELISAYDSGVTVEALAGKHGRTRGAIQSRLTKLGRMPLGTAQQAVQLDIGKAGDSGLP